MGISNDIVTKAMEFSMRCRFLVRRALFGVGSFALLVAAAPLQCHGSGGVGPRSHLKSSKVILEVINRHFTVGKKIPSVYLRVYADGTAECHTEKYWDEPDVVKSKTLAAQDFEKLKRLLEEPALSTVQHRYERPYQVVDSWMEWNIKVQHDGHTQTIQVAGFSPSAARERNQPYPDILLKLGCSVQGLRADVYGDAPPETEDCKAALAVN